MNHDILKYMFECKVDGQDCKFIVRNRTRQGAIEQFRELCSDTFGTTPHSYSCRLLEIV